MSDLRRLIEEETANNPAFAEELAESRAEVELAMEIVRLRRQRGMTQEKLAETAGMPQSMVARYEMAGRTPKLASIWKLANALGATFVFGPDYSVRGFDCAPEQLRPCEAPEAGHRSEGRTGTGARTR